MNFVLSIASVIGLAIGAAGCRSANHTADMASAALASGATCFNILSKKLTDGETPHQFDRHSVVCMQPLKSAPEVTWFTFSDAQNGEELFYLGLGDARVQPRCTGCRNYVSASGEQQVSIRPGSMSVVTNTFSAVYTLEQNAPTTAGQEPGTNPGQMICRGPGTSTLVLSAAQDPELSRSSSAMLTIGRDAIQNPGRSFTLTLNRSIPRGYNSNPQSYALAYASYENPNYAVAVSTTGVNACTFVFTRLPR